MNKLIVSSAPHLVTKRTTQSIMFEVLLAMLPAAVSATVIFGIDALIRIVFCMAMCALFEVGFQLITKRPITIKDGSALVTGVLLAFTLPSNFPLAKAAVGCFVAIVVAKQLFGGLGRNFANPALVGRIVLMLSFSSDLSGKYPMPQSADVLAGATPLSGNWQGSVLDLLLGNRAGALGEACSITLLIGGIYLVVRKITTISIPLSYVGGVAVFALIGGTDPIANILMGGVLMGAFFMATDYVTSPITESGKVIYGICCAALTMIIRFFGSYPEGVAFSILVMNVFTPLIDNLTLSKPLGGVKDNG